MVGQRDSIYPEFSEQLARLSPFGLRKELACRELKGDSGEKIDYRLRDIQ